jgi:hypothetical protein
VSERSGGPDPHEGDRAPVQPLKRYFPPKKPPAPSLSEGSGPAKGGVRRNLRDDPAGDAERVGGTLSDRLGTSKVMTRGLRPWRDGRAAVVDVGL